MPTDQLSQTQDLQNQLNLITKQLADLKQNVSNLLSAGQKINLGQIPQGPGSNLNADRVDGINASRQPAPNVLVPTGSDGKLPTAILPSTGPTGPAGGDLSGTYPNPTVKSTHLTSPLPINQGGTGVSSFTASLSGHVAIVYADATGLSSLAVTPNALSFDPGTNSLAINTNQDASGLIGHGLHVSGGSQATDIRWDGSPTGNSDFSWVLENGGFHIYREHSGGAQPFFGVENSGQFFARAYTRGMITAAPYALAGGIFSSCAENTGAGSASLAMNCPAVDPTTPYTWLTTQTQDGSTVYFPVWK